MIAFANEQHGNDGAPRVHVHTREGSNSVAGDLLRSYVERIERFEAEIKDLNSEKSDVYQEAKSSGLDPKIIREVVAIRRKDHDARMEHDAILGLYLAALGMA